MKILFIYPDPLNTSNTPFKKIQRIFFNSPIATFEALGGVTPQEHTIEIIDERLELLHFETNCDLVGISAMTYQAPRAYAIADEFLQRGKKVILGGWHPSAIPQEAKQHASSVVIGEGEEVWPQIIKDAEQGTLKHEYRQEKPIDFSALPCSRPSKRRRTLSMTTPIEATRGCPYGCTFCAISNSTGYGIFHTKPLERLIAEIQSIPQKYLLFNDASLTIDVDYTKQLFRQMKTLNKKFFCFGNSNLLLKDEDLLKLAHEAGCISWSVGFDSILQESLDGISKRTNVVDEYKAVIKRIHTFGMNVTGSFIVGFDSDTPDVFDDTIDFICDSDIDSAAFHILTPFPGTPLFHMIDQQNRILTKDWSKYDCTNVVFQPKQMTGDDLKNGYLQMYKDFYRSNLLKIIGRNVTKGLFPFYISVAHSWQVFNKFRSSSS
jgi:radical SAM superfamily enzyme YgiQ (UPF0313 family)